jgi:flagellar basal body-associated protein FliL
MVAAMRMLRFLPVMFALAAFAPARADEQPRAEHKITQSVSYMMLEPFYATIIQAGRPNGMLMVAFGLDIPDASLRAETEHALPLLRDAYVRSLMTFSATAVRVAQQPDVNQICDRLQRVTDRTLKKKGARVLLAQVAMRITH